MRIRRSTGARWLPIVLGVLTLAAGNARAVAQEEQVPEPAMFAPRIAEVTEIGWVTGEHSPNRTGTRFNVYGTDLGTMWDSGHGTVLLAFGDTFGPGAQGHGAPGGSDWRSNVLGRSADADLRDGLDLDMVTDYPGHAAQVIPRNRSIDEVTVIPTGGVSVGGRQYLYYMSVRRWEGHGRWHTNYLSVAYSDDGGNTWHTSPQTRWENPPQRTNVFQLGTPVRAGGYVYLFGTPNGRFDAAFLARVPEDKVLDKSAYTYWSGATWHPDQAEARPVFAAPVGELSVRYHAGAGRWLASYLDEERGAIVLRTAPSLTGPWTDPHPLVTSREYPGLYGGFLHPWTMNGQDIYFLMSVWEPYNVLLMHARLDWGWRAPDVPGGEAPQL